jgi:competence protein ComFB
MRGNAMSLQEQYNFEYLVNETEKIVLQELENQLKNNNKVCKCQDCVLDMAAYAMNHTKPYYRVSLLGKLYTGSVYNTEAIKEVKKAVKEAIKKIQENPSHD